MNATRAIAIAQTKQGLPRESEALLSEDNTDPLARAVHQFFPKSDRVFVLHSVPEQAEDIYWLLVGPREIAKLEIPRGGEDDESDVSLEMISIEAYIFPGVSRVTRRRLQAALALI